MTDFNDPLDAAKRRFQPSYFPAANLQTFGDRSDLIKDTENAFYGGGNAPAPSPTPVPSTPWWKGWNRTAPASTPTPSPVRESYFSRGQFPNFTGFQRFANQSGSIFSPQHEDQGDSILKSSAGLQFTPEDLARRYNEQQIQNEKNRARTMNEVPMLGMNPDWQRRYGFNV